MMTDLETIELALRRALSTEKSAMPQDLSTIHVLDLVITEIERIRSDRQTSDDKRTGDNK